MTSLALLNSLTPAQQVQQVPCPNSNCRASEGQHCLRLRERTVCPGRWGALRAYRFELAFWELGGESHTGVPCPRCRASVGEPCVALHERDNAPAHYSRVEASVRLASRMANDYTGQLTKVGL